MSHGAPRSNCDFCLSHSRDVYCRKTTARFTIIAGSRHTKPSLGRFESMSRCASVALVFDAALVAAPRNVEEAVETPVLQNAIKIETKKQRHTCVGHLVPRVCNNPVVLACVCAPAKQPDRVATKQLACDVFINAGLVAAGRGEEGEGMSGRGWDEAVGRWCG